MSVRPLPEAVIDRIRSALDEPPSDLERWLTDLSAAAGPGDPVHSEAVRLLLNVTMDDSEARALLEAILEHRRSWTRSLGRDPGMSVATLDYVVDGTSLLGQPVVIEQSRLREAVASSTQDPVTGLLRAGQFDDELRREFARGRRRGEPFALLLIEIDGFRSGVDRFGHRLGEALLREVADVVRGGSRKCDRPARLERGRFAVLLPGTDRHGAFTVAERIRLEARASLRDRVTDERPTGHTVSGGIAIRPIDAASPEELYERAESGLAVARANGGDSVSLYHSERRRAIRYPVRPSSRVAVTSAAGLTAAGAQALDLSEQGALLEVDGRFDADRVHVYVRRTDAGSGSPGWSAFADVVRREDRGDGRHRMGVRFERSVPAVRLREFAFSTPGSAPVGRAP